MTASSPIAYAAIEKTPGAIRSWPDRLRFAGMACLLGAIAAAMMGVGLMVQTGWAVLACGVLQGLMLGFGYGWLLRHNAIQKRSTRYGFALLTLVVCTVLTLYELYLHDLYLLARLVNGGGFVQSLSDVATGHAARLYRQFVVDDWMGNGFLTDIVGQAKRNGGFVHIMMLSLVMNTFGLYLAVKQSPDFVWCRRCRSPWAHEKNLLFLPEANARDLINAVANEDSEAAQHLTQLAATAPAGNVWTIGRLMACHRCDRRAVDVIHKRFYSQRNITTHLTEPIDTPEGFIALLQSAPATPTA